MNRVADTKANAMLFYYVKDASYGDFYPDRIEYTLNAATGLAPGNVVKFEYETRPDVVAIWQGGSFNKSRVRMTKIRTSTNGAVTPVLEYRISYAPSPAESEPPVSTISSIALCAASAPCLPALNLGLAAGPTQTAFDTSQYWVGQQTDAKNVAVGDFNGDGRQDFIAYTGANGTWHLCLSTGSSFNCSSVQAHAGGTGNNVTGDLNGDGLTDLAAYTGANGTWHVCLATGSGFNCTFQQAIGTKSAVVGDFNGDGLMDLAGYTGANATWHVCLSTGSGFTCSFQQAHSGGPSNNVVGDFNGDGRSDLAGYTGANGTWHVCLSNGAGFDCALQQAHWGGTNDNVAGDFNGDGLTDLAGYTGANGTWHVCLSTGTGFDCSLQQAIAAEVKDAVSGDFNGDGLTDLAGYTGSAGTWHLCLSTGTGFACGFVQAHSGGTANNIAGDLNGDGALDLAAYTGSNARWHVNLALSPKRQTSTFARAIGGTSTATYARLPEILGTRYMKELGVSGNKVPMVSPLLVVTDVDTTNGIGGTRRTSHSYGTAILERGGRGFLGFDWTQVEDKVSGIVSRSSFHLDFPYTGLVKVASQGTSTASPGNLSVANAAYDCVMPSGSGMVPCIVAPGNRYFVYPKQVDSQKWDLNGVPLPWTRTRNSNPDLFGNLQYVTTVTLNPDGSPSDYSKTVFNTYYNDATNWYLGRLTKSVVTTSGPTVPAPVVPGSGAGSLPPTPSPTMVTPQVMSIILNLLLDD